MKCGWVLGLALGLVMGCSQRGDCEKICVRVSECRRAVPEHEQIIGEKRPAPDPGCLERCKSNPEGFAACEKKERMCGDLLECQEAR